MGGASASFAANEGMQPIFVALKRFLRRDSPPARFTRLR